MVVGVLTGRTDWTHEVTQEENSLAQRMNSAILENSTKFVGKERVVLTNISISPSDKSSTNTGSEFDSAIAVYKLN